MGTMIVTKILLVVEHSQLSWFWIDNCYWEPFHLLQQSVTEQHIPIKEKKISEYFASFHNTEWEDCWQDECCPYCCRVRIEHNKCNVVFLCSDNNVFNTSKWWENLSKLIFYIMIFFWIPFHFDCVFQSLWRFTENSVSSKFKWTKRSQKNEFSYDLFVLFVCMIYFSQRWLWQFFQLLWFLLVAFFREFLLEFDWFLLLFFVFLHRYQFFFFLLQVHVLPTLYKKINSLEWIHTLTHSMRYYVWLWVFSVRSLSLRVSAVISNFLFLASIFACLFLSYSSLFFSSVNRSNAFFNAWNLSTK